MSTETQTDLQSFHEFIAEKLRRGEKHLSPEEALALRREQLATVTAIQEALDDMAAGDEGEPVEDVLAELRQKIQNRKVTEKKDLPCQNPSSRQRGSFPHGTMDC